MLSAVVFCPVSSSSCSVYCGDRVINSIVEANEEGMSLRLNATKSASRFKSDEVFRDVSKTGLVPVRKRQSKVVGVWQAQRANVAAFM
jgi:hypothetical protein